MPCKRSAYEGVAGGGGVSMSGQNASVAEPIHETERRAGNRPKQQPRYQVVLWNDDDHTYLYVIGMMAELFGHPLEKGYQIAREVDQEGRAVVLVTTKEHAELKRDQIHAYGRDRTMASSKGSMWATIEAVDD